MTVEQIEAFTLAHASCEAPPPAVEEQPLLYWRRTGAACVALAAVGDHAVSIVTWCPACQEAMTRTLTREQLAAVRMPAVN